MTVKVINVEELNRLVNDATRNEAPSGFEAIAVRLEESEIKATSKETWSIIKSKLNGLPDMTFTCSSVTSRGNKCKNFIFSGTNSKEIVQTVNYINELVRNKNNIEFNECSSIFNGGHNVDSGPQASCPMFK